MKVLILSVLLDPYDDRESVNNVLVVPEGFDFEADRMEAHKRFVAEGVFPGTRKGEPLSQYRSRADVMHIRSIYERFGEFAWEEVQV